MRHPLMFVFAALSTLCGPLPTLAQEACSTYQVKRGDTLILIARRAYGKDRARAIFEANRAVLPKPDAIEIGQVLRLPCADGSLPPGTEGDRLLALQPAAPTEPGPAPRITATLPGLLPGDPLPSLPAAAPRLVGEGELRLVTDDSFAPLVDFSRPGRGLIPELIGRVMETSAPDQPWRLDAVRDASAQIELLLPLGAFDIGFPWLRPACPAPISASLVTQRLCESYVFSDPVLTLETRVWVRDGSALLTSGLPASVCLPLGYLGPDPRADGSLPAATTVTTAASLDACADRVASGADEAMLVNPEMLAAALPGLAEVARLSASHPVVLIAPRANGAAVARMADLNDRLALALADGEWTRLAVQEIAAWRARLRLLPK